MTPIAKKRLILARNVVLVLGLVAVLPYAAQSLRSFAASDAFARLRGSTGPNQSPVGMELENVDLRHYRGQELKTHAVAGKVQVSADRQLFELFDVTNGVYYADKGSLEFKAKEAVWNAPLRTLFIRNGVQVKNKDVNLRSPELTFNERTNMLEVKKEITGKLYEGEVKAVTFKYNVKTGAFEAGPTHWKGNVKLKVQDGQVSEQPTRWEFDSKSAKNNTATKTITYTNAVARDGEIILKAPKVEHARETDVVTATGGVEYYSPEANLVADKVVVYRKEKRAVLTGNVRMLVKPEDEQEQPAKIEPIPEFKKLSPTDVNIKPSSVRTEEEKKQVEELRSSDSARKYPLQIVAGYIEYFYGKGNRKATIRENPQARQEFASGMWRHMWTERALYDGEKEILTLYSKEGAGDADKARMKNSFGDDVIAKVFEVSTKKDDEDYEGTEMKAVYWSISDELERERRNRSGSGTGGTTGGGTTGGTGGGTTGGKR